MGQVTKSTTLIVVMALVIFYIQEINNKLEQKPSKKELTLLALQEDSETFKSLPKELKKDEIFLKQAIEINGQILQYLDPKYKADKKWVLSAVKKDGLTLQYASNMLKSDEEVVAQAVKENGEAFEFAHPYLKKNRAYVLKLLKKKRSIISHADRTLQQDKSLIEMALKYDEQAFMYVDEALQEDKSYIKKIVKNNGWIFYYIDESFKTDKEIISLAVSNNPYILTDVNVSFQKDKTFLLTLIEKNKDVLDYIDESIWKDNVFLLSILQSKGFGLEYATPQQQNDRDLVLKAVGYDAFSLEYASDTLKKDPNIVLKAVSSYSDALQFADKVLLTNKAFIKKAIEINEYSISSIDNDLSKDKELVTLAVRKNPNVLEYLPLFNKDKDFIVEMIKKDINVLPYIDASLKNNPTILKAVESFPSKYASIEKLLSYLALILLVLFIWFFLVKKEKHFAYLGSAMVLVVVVEVLQTYFVHGLFRMPYVMVDANNKFGLERIRCWMGEEVALSSTECYNMHVPEIYNDPQSRVITFPVRVLRSGEMFPQKSPLIHLGGGGPGADMGLDSAYVLNYHVEEHDAFTLNQGRDFIIMDPRGAGLSEPLLNCDTYVKNFLGNMKKELTLEEGFKAIENDYTDCITKLTKRGVNFNGYNSIAVADDVHLLRKFIHANQVILFGISYSTIYSLFVAKKYPEMVESMILDSTCFPNLKLDHNYLAQKMDGYNALYNYREKIKNLAHNENINISERMWTLHQKLNEHPIHIEYFNLKLNGNNFIYTLLEGRYGTEIFKDLPTIIRELENNNTTTFLPYFKKYIDFQLDDTYADVSAMAHYCYEDKPFINFKKIKDQHANLPKGFIQQTTILTEQANDFCQEMNISSVDKTLAQAIKTAIPTLFIHGEFDSVTPLRDVIEEMKNFSNAKLLTYQTAHSVLGTEDKVEEDIAKFLTDFLSLKNRN